MTPNGSLFPFPEITGSLPAPTGFEFVDTLISASNDVISMDDVNKSLYKEFTITSHICSNQRELLLGYEH